MQVLNHHDQPGLLGQPSQEPEQQFEQARLGSLVGRAAGLRCAQGGQQPSKFTPGGADQLTDRSNADVGGKGSHGLHDRGIGQGAIADRHTATNQHPGPLGGASGG